MSLATNTGTPAGFRTVSPYITVVEVDRLMRFAQDAFGAIEQERDTGSGGGVNLTVRIAGTNMYFAGGAWATGREKVNDVRLWVPNVDEVYARALAAGATSVTEPGDRPYGERNCGVKDPTGNTWWIATRFDSSPLPEGFGNASCYLKKRDALGLIDFVKRVFAAEEALLHRTPDGGLMHGAVRIGTSMLEFGEHDTPPSAFYVFVGDVDATYQQALEAGAKSIYPPADHSYGHRSGGVEDRWGNTWYIAREITAEPPA